MRAILASLLLCVAVCGQVTQVLLPPTGTPTSNTPQPFASGIGRYQEWFSPGFAALLGGQPCRIQGVNILAGVNTAASPSTVLDLEVYMAHAPSFGLLSSFDINYSTPRVTVLPRTTVTLRSAAAGSVALQLPFTNAFTWNGTSAFLVEIKVYGNSRNNQPFAFDLRGTDLAQGNLIRLYAGGNASAANGTLVQGQGLFMQFTTRVGAKLGYGVGCPGVNGVTPTCDTQQLAQPGTVWIHQLSNSAAQTLAIFALGGSRSSWDTGNGIVSLPLDLGPALNAGGCLLQASPDIMFSVFTVGGPGTAGASVQIQVPPIASYAGVSIYSQWFVLDPAALNGSMSATAALHSVIAGVGG